MSHTIWNTMIVKIGAPVNNSIRSIVFGHGTGIAWPPFSQPRPIRIMRCSVPPDVPQLGPKWCRFFCFLPFLHDSLDECLVNLYKVIPLHILTVQAKRYCIALTNCPFISFNLDFRVFFTHFVLEYSKLIFNLF